MGGGQCMKKKLYLFTTRDEYELPIFVADSAKEMSEMTGFTIGSVYKCISAGYSGWHKVIVDMEDDE